MISKLRKKLLPIGLCVFLSSYTFLQMTIPVQATDYAAEEEARKSLPIASNSYEDWPAGPAVGAEGAILMEANTGTILYEKNIHEHLYPASTTKILTCLIASEKCDMNDTVIFSNDAVFSIPRDSSNMGMDVGEAISVEQCLYGILVGSANEAANAVAEHVSGSIEAFVGLMNDKAKELGCNDSHFVTTNGLHDENHYTSPYDLALIAKEFFKNELLCKMSSTPTYYIPQSATQPDDDLYIHSKNKLYSNGQYAYDYLVGSKTGYTDDARQTLVSCAQKDGLKLICVVMKEESPNQFTDTVSLFDYGFSNFHAVNIASNDKNYSVENDNFIQTENDVFGSSKSILSLNTSAYIVLPITAEFEDTQSKLSYDEKSESSVATIQYTYHDIPVGSATVDLAKNNENTSFDFETEPESEENIEETASGMEADSVIFINVKKVIFWILGISGIIIFAFVVKSIINNYQFSKRRSRKTRKKKKPFPSEFDHFNF